MNIEIVKTAASEFKSALYAGCEGIARAARIYVEFLDREPLKADEFRSLADDMVPFHVWSLLEQVGRKQLHPRLLLGGGRHGNVIRRLPYSIQEKILERKEKFELVTSGGEILKVDLQTCEPEQIAQIVDGDQIREPSAQRAYIENRKARAALAKKPEPAELLPYQIIGGAILFRKDCRLTKRELKKLVETL